MPEVQNLKTEKKEIIETLTLASSIGSSKNPSGMG